jgi:hypothetical protein
MDAYVVFNIGEVLIPSFLNPIFSTQLSTVSCNILPRFSCLPISCHKIGRTLNVFSSISDQGTYPTDKFLQLALHVAVAIDSLLNILWPKFTRPTKQRAKLGPKKTYQRDIEIIHHRPWDGFDFRFTWFGQWFLDPVFLWPICRERLFKFQCYLRHFFALLFRRFCLRGIFAFRFAARNRFWGWRVFEGWFWRGRRES